MPPWVQEGESMVICKFNIHDTIAEQQWSHGLSKLGSALLR